MAKVTGPLLSLRSSGSIAKSQVYGSWKGVPYARQHVIPTNPRSTEQTKTRSVFGNLMLIWKSYGTIAQGPFRAFATGKPLTPRNAFAQANVSILRTETDLTKLVGSMSSGGGVTATSLTAVAGAASGGIAATLTCPAAPTGWTLAKVQAIAVRNTDPHSPLEPPVGEAEDDAPTEAGATIVQLTGLVAGAEYAVSAWPVWDKGSGKLAFGQSITVIASAMA